MPESLEQSDPNARVTLVERDSTFHRSVADTGLVVDLGRDIEIAFLQIGPAIAARVRTGPEDDENEGYQMRPAVTEVSRVRMPRASALTTAMMIIESLTEAKRIKRDEFLKQVQTLFDRYPDDDAD